MKSSKKLTGFHLQEAQQRAAKRAKMLVGATGDMGEKGDRGNDGLPGIAAVGETGDKGERGLRGLQGDDGHSIKGDKGDKGEDGRKGDKGDDGRGIISTKIIKGDLWVFYTDGTKQNTGKLPRGRDGISRIIGGVSGGSGSGSTWKPLEKFTLTAQNIIDGYVDLTATPKSNSEFVFVNGLHEDCYTITTNRLDFSLLGLLAGEKLTVKYQI